MTSYPFNSLEATHLIQLTFKQKGLHKGMNTGRWGSLGVILEAAHHNMVRVHRSNGYYLLCPIHGGGFSDITANLH